MLSIKMTLREFLISSSDDIATIYFRLQFRRYFLTAMLQTHAGIRKSIWVLLYL